ncbi:winged helix-turn-helix domain-containing protein [Pseudorhodoferax sp.]|uniref:winged helix-turn-helix domain-containing protein n=1 Tax=Pseudorhodoferax sp. TaxID=1993553 RepID=UPI002DD69872|nr:winged helix-turn-helix domain-containing protein [Pseudorhodoferax sp.]
MTSATDSPPTPAPPPGPAPLRVGRWQVEAELDEIALGTQRVKLEPRCMRLLLLLASQPGRVWESDALIDGIWPHVVVTPNSLYQAVAELRRILRADRETATFIATVPRRGYRMVAPVAFAAARAPAPGPAPASAAPPAPRPSLGPRSVAVLPFRTRGLPEALGFLRESLLGELVAELSRQPQLATIARGTMLTYADMPVAYPVLAAQLGVRFVVDGSIESLAPAAGGGLRIVADLVDTRSGQQIWSEALELEHDAWPTLGQQVAGRLARVLNLELAAGAVRRPAPPEDAGGQALGAALRAWVELYCRPQTRDTNDRAWQYALEALAADETQAIAWNALAYCEWRAAQYAWHRRPRDELLHDALQHAGRAIDLDPRDPEPHYTFALCSMTLGEPQRAEAALRHCIGLSPSYAPAHGLMGLVCTMLGRPEETSALCARAFALSPHEPLRVIWHWSEAWAALALDDSQAALQHAQRGMTANPDFPSCHLVAAVAAHRLGDAATAARCIAVLRRNPAFASTEAIVRNLPLVPLARGGARVLADLQAAGLPGQAASGPPHAPAPRAL